MINIIIMVDRLAYASKNPTKIIGQFGFDKKKCNIRILAPHGTCVGLRADVIINAISPIHPRDTSPLIEDHMAEWMEHTKLRLTPDGVYIDLKDYNARPHVPNSTR